MVSTVQAGLQAGQVATAIQMLQAQIAQLQDVIAKGYTVNSIVAQIQDPTGAVSQLQANLPLNAADSNTLFNDVLTLYQNALTNLNAQLAAIS